MATKVQLTLKKKPIWPATSIDNLFDPVTGKKADLSKIISVTDYKINNKAAVNGNFTITAQDVGAATATHTHTAADVGAAAANHTHTAAEVGAATSNHHHSVTDIDGLDARLAGINPETVEVEGGFAMSLLNSTTYPEPSTWTSANN